MYDVRKTTEEEKRLMATVLANDPEFDNLFDPEMDGDTPKEEVAYQHLLHYP